MAESRRARTCCWSASSSSPSRSRAPGPPCPGARVRARVGRDRHVRRRSGADPGRDPGGRRAAGDDDPRPSGPGRRGFQPVADPRPVSGRPARAGAGGAGHGAPLHGVPRRQRRARVVRRWGRAPGAAGQLQRLRGVAGDAGAGDRAGARRARARSGRPGGERGRRRRARARGAAADARPAGRVRAADGTLPSSCRWCSPARRRDVPGRSRRRGAPGTGAGADARARQGRGPTSRGWAARAARRALRSLPHDAARRPPAHAAPRRAADRLHVRGLLGAALRRRRVPADGHAGAVAGRLRLRRGDVGGLPDPDRAGVLHALDGDRVGRRVLSEPGGRDRIGAGARVLGAPGRPQPGARAAGRRRRGAGRQPLERTRRSTRSCRSTAVTSWSA